MSKPCEIGEEVKRVSPAQAGLGPVTRRSFMRRLGGTAAGLTTADFLSFFLANGLPADARAAELARGAAQANDDPHFLVYWYLEGGWCGYDMFNPVDTANHVVDRLDDISQERYRVLKWGKNGYGIHTQDDIRYGFLATPGKDLFKDMAILSSMQTGQGHSTERLRVHMGSYKFRNSNEREDDERSVMQAFAEVHGQSYVLPNLSWHWWLSDGELNEVQYRGRRGYYHALGPRHAHTIYAGTPAKLKKLLLQIQEDSGNQVGREIESFLSDAHNTFLKDENISAVKSYNSARDIFLELEKQGYKLDRSRLLKLFADPALKEEFGIKPADELITYRSVNGNKARSKFTPHVNVQAMMSYELMKEGLSCAFFIESRDVRHFDSHTSRKKLWRKDGTPVGMPDQTEKINRDLWDPLQAYVKRLKNTEYKNTGKSFYDHTNIVLTSEFGRSLHGNVNEILKKDISNEKKQSEIGGQDICAHWKVTSCAFLGGNVKGNHQYGAVGTETLMPIPILPDGSLDPNYALTGKLKKDREKHPKSSLPGHGDVYATALELSDIDPAGRGRNERGPLSFIKRG